MPVLRNPSAREFMPAKWSTVIVGVHADTGTVGKIWVHKNGSMMFGSLVCRPSFGRTSIGEAITAFGLTRIRRFQAGEVLAANAYARRVAIEIG